MLITSLDPNINRLPGSLAVLFVSMEATVLYFVAFIVPDILTHWGQ